jgi:aspartate racemase
MTPLPLVSLLDVIVAEVERRQLQRIAILGARVTIETKLFGRLQNVDVVSPTPAEIDLVSRTYLRIVEEGHASQNDYENLRVLAHTLIDRERVNAILLAGTDLSFVINPNNIDFPHLDGARVHIDAIMRTLVPDGA